MNAPHSQHRSQWVGLTLLGLCFLVIGWLAGFAWVNRATIGELWLQASEQKYLTMTGEAGPVTYLVTHTDYNAVEAFGFKHDDVLGVEIYAYPDKVAVAFTAADSASILALSNSKFVIAMNQQVIPMMCH